MTGVNGILGADILLNNSGLYFDGPQVAQGNVGTWFVHGTVTLLDPVTAPSTIHCRLWDGLNILSSTTVRLTAAAGGFTASLSGIIANPAGNLRISCNQPAATTGKILFNSSGTNKDSTINAVRIA